MSDTSEEQRYWKTIEREALMRSIAKSEAAAKQLISLTAFLSALYAGVISFNGDLKQTVSGLFLLLFVAPLPIWLAALYLATRVILPRGYGAKQFQEKYSAMSKFKYICLRGSYKLLLLSSGLLLVNVSLYLFYIPTPLPGVQP